MSISPLRTAPMLPSLQDLDRAVKNLEVYAADPYLRRCRPRWEGTTLLSFPGGTSCVYPVTVDNRTKALRCWKTLAERQEERYRHITDLLDRVEIPCMVKVHYIARGLVIREEPYPVVLMDWVEAPTLADYLDAKHDHSEAIERLSESFVDTVRVLHDNRIAHGDLQDGNILVADDGNDVSIKLVDYDTLYMPSLGQWPNDATTTIPAYRHPERGASPYLSSSDDHFSELVIYLSLLAIVENPFLWKPGTEQRLLFSEDDYRDPETSPTFALLLRMSPRIRRLSRILHSFCAVRDTRLIPPLERVLTQRAVLVGTYFGVENVGSLPPDEWGEPPRRESPGQAAPPQAPPATREGTEARPVWKEYFERREGGRKSIRTPSVTPPPATHGKVATTAVVLGIGALVLLFLFILSRILG